MADNTYRSYRGGDPYARGNAAPADSEPANDPLAELARLIGQNDPFGNLSRDARRAAAEPHYDSTQAPEVDWATERYAEPDRYDTPPLADAGVSPQYRDHDEPAAERPYPGTERNFDDARYAAAPDDSRYYDEHGSAQEPHDSPSSMAEQLDDHDYDAAHREQDDHDLHAQYDDSASGYQTDESYDEAAAQPRRRGGLVVVMAVLGLAVLGTAGAFAYRAMFGGAMLPALPPVIKASNTPNKVVPPGQGDDAQKATDRVANAGQGEKVVPREEQPVDMAEPKAQQPRVISTIPVAPAPAAPAPVAAAPASAPVSAPAQGSPFPPPPVQTQTGAVLSNPQTVASEPKKVRTVVIRPDQGGAPVPVVTSPPVSTRSVAPRPVPPPPRASAPPPPPPSENAPLALVPQGGAAEAGAPAAPAPRVHTTLARAHTPAAPTGAADAPSGTGGYAVQVSSQHSEAEAHAAFRSLQAKFPDQLGSRAAVIRRADLGSKGVFYRAMVGPFASAEEAAGMCSNLKAAGGTCLIQKN